MSYTKVYNSDNPAFHLKPDLDQLLEDIDAQQVSVKGALEKLDEDEIIEIVCLDSIKAGSSHQKIDALRGRFDDLKRTFQTAKDERLEKGGCFTGLITWWKFRPLSQKIKKTQNALLNLRCSFSVQDQRQRKSWFTCCTIFGERLKKQMGRVKEAYKTLKKTPRLLAPIRAAQVNIESREVNKIFNDIDSLNRQFLERPNLFETIPMALLDDLYKQYQKISPYSTKFLQRA